MLGTTYDVKAIQTRLYDDPLVQYNKGIDVPFLKPKVFLKQTSYEFTKWAECLYIYKSNCAGAEVYTCAWDGKCQPHWSWRCDHSHRGI